MDSITQGLLAATIADAGFRERLGPKATMFGLACGLLPDADLVMRLAGEWASFLSHRGYSHALIVQTLVSPLIGYVGYLSTKKQASFRLWTLLAFLTLTTHSLLDWCTSYGTQLWLPLSTYRYSCDAVAIIDPFYSIILIIGILLALFGIRLTRRKLRPTILTLILSTAYLAAGYAISTQYEYGFRRRLESQGVSVEAVRAMPMPFSLFVWRLAARDTDGRVHVEVRSVWRREAAARDVVQSDRSPYVDRALSTEYGKRFKWFSDNFLIAKVEKNVDAVRVYLRDQRYGSLLDPGQGGFGALVKLSEDGRVLKAERIRHGAGRRMKEELSALWLLMLGESIEHLLPPRHTRHAATRENAEEEPPRGQNVSP